MLLKASTELPVKSEQGAHDARAGDAQTETGANVGEMDGDMGVRSKYRLMSWVLSCNNAKKDFYRLIFSTALNQNRSKNFHRIF